MLKANFTFTENSQLVPRNILEGICLDVIKLLIVTPVYDVITIYQEVGVPFYRYLRLCDVLTSKMVARRKIKSDNGWHSTLLVLFPCFFLNRNLKLDYISINLII